MAMNEDFERDPLSGGSFSQLLCSNDDVMGFDMTESLFYPSSSSSFPPGNSPTMLCFETSRKESPVVNKQKQENNKISSGGDQTCSASSSNNSSSSGSGVVTVTTTTKSKKSQSEEENTEQERRHTGAPNPGTKRETKKKQKTDTLPTPTSTRPVKVRRKEKLGERVTALQQLVSPFGKTDTASVLHEAMGYIRFLHDQVQVLSSPYLQSMPSSAHQDGRGIGENGKEVKYDLRSRGLCLVPVEYTQVASSNGADFWSPAMGSNNNNSSTVKHQ